MEMRKKNSTFAKAKDSSKLLSRFNLCGSFSTSL